MIRLVDAGVDATGRGAAALLHSVGALFELLVHFSVAGEVHALVEDSPRSLVVRTLELPIQQAVRGCIAIEHSVARWQESSASAKVNSEVRHLLIIGPAVDSDSSNDVSNVAIAD